ncbi:MAG: type II toxin-antitoxin system HigB family toxin [Anaerolineales bacterium]|nr:type II toxin-antitoxin system HigB family toxin [Anaerolineales bacterium]
MRVIAKSTLVKFWASHPDVADALRAWYVDVSKADWGGPSDLKAIYATVSILRDNRAVFNIKGNKYRLVVKVNYSAKIVFIRFVGTHAQYDRIDAEAI